MQTTAPFADSDDVADVWRPLSQEESYNRIPRLIDRAWAKLRSAVPFDIEERVALYGVEPRALTALDPMVVADVVATMVKRFLVNTDGATTITESAGVFSHSATYVNRYDKTGSDVRGAIQVTPSDIEQLRPAVPAPTAGTIRTNVPQPRILLPRGGGSDGTPGQPEVLSDVWPGSGVE